MFNSLFKAINMQQSDFAKNTLYLSLGTFVAQALPFLFYPLLGRIYSPEDFGVLVILQTVIQILSIFFSGSFENAILITKSKEEEINLIKLIIIRAFLLFCTTTIIIPLIYVFLDPEWDKSVKSWLLLAPFIAFCVVVFNCFNEWSVKEKRFTGLAINKIINSSSIALSKVFFGLLSLFRSGLVAGEYLGKLITAIVCAYKIFKSDKKYLLTPISLRKIQQLYWSFFSFPKVMMADQILNNIGGTLHVYFISNFFSSKELGYFSMAATLLTVPVTVISAAIKDVFRQRAQIDYSTKGNCRPFFIKILKPLIVAAIIVSVPLYWFIPIGFEFFLGPKWSLSADYAQIMIPMFISNFVSQSLGGIFIIAKKFNISLLWQIYVIVTSSLAFIVGAYYFKSLMSTLLLYSAARTSAYIVYGMLSFHYAKNGNEIE